MNNGFIIFVPDLILLALFIIYIWHRQSLKTFNWATLTCTALGIALLALVIMLILQNQPEMGPLQILLIALPALFFILFLLFLTRVITLEQVKSRLRMDERITSINAKSARNALFSVYLGTVINLIICSSISTLLLLEILGVSLVIYIASMVIYYFYYRSF